MIPFLKTHKICLFIVYVCVCSEIISNYRTFRIAAFLIGSAEHVT